ncbi:MAG: hypothetical protein R3190_10120, partial [Thermoanaerobaculia bacterium]|nr:hypothetical protein [Thermoanaerobaculia bacterium]
MLLRTATTTLLALLALCGIGLLASSCILESDGAFQTLVLFFELDRQIPEGEAFLVHTMIYPNRVELRKQFVRISGRIDPSPDAFAEMSDEGDARTMA